MDVTKITEHTSSFFTVNESLNITIATKSVTKSVRILI